MYWERFNSQNQVACCSLGKEKIQVAELFGRQLKISLKISQTMTVAEKRHRLKECLKLEGP